MSIKITNIFITVVLQYITTLTIYTWTIVRRFSWTDLWSVITEDSSKSKLTLMSSHLYLNSAFYKQIVSKQLYCDNSNATKFVFGCTAAVNGVIVQLKFSDDSFQ